MDLVYELHSAATRMELGQKTKDKGKGNKEAGDAGKEAAGGIGTSSRY